jgi:Zn-dependent protease with chaperone function
VLVFGIVALSLTATGDRVAGLVAGAAAGVAVSLSLLLGGTRTVLRALRARLTDEDDLPRAHNLVEGLCASMGLRLPSIWVVDDDARDAIAFGAGSRTAALVLTSGVADTLDPVALEGLLAHELTHIKRLDIAPATAAAALFLPFASLLPGVSSVVHRLAGRGRELRTDRLAVGVTRYPPGLREALAQLSSGPRPSNGSPLARRGVSRATRWLWTVALPSDSAVAGRAEDLEGELDAVDVRIAALDEW